MVIFQYTTLAGRQPVKDFIDELPLESRYEILTLLRRLENGEVLGMPHARSMASMSFGSGIRGVRYASSIIPRFEIRSF